MRNCPVCSTPERTQVFSLAYRPPDGWPLPTLIEWFTCDSCGMFYGDGDFDQAMLNDYYTRFYGYGVDHPENTERLIQDAGKIEVNMLKQDGVVVDFGGAGDGGGSILADELKRRLVNAVAVGPMDEIPECDVLYASHVLEHIYTLPETMDRITDALKDDGLLIVDVPDSTGLVLKWHMPMMDFNTKHVNHFTLRDLLNLGWRYGLEMVDMKRYTLNMAPAVQVHFKKFDTADASANLIRNRLYSMRARLLLIDRPVNVWGMGDITWHLLSEVDLEVLDYIDNDPAYRGQTYKGKPVVERPTNDAPILIMAQGQKQRLIENIRKAGVTNEIIEV